jgi:hypothetical protein
VIGYLFTTAKLILDGRISPHDITKELLLPLGYLGVACLLFLDPIFFLFGFVRIIYAFAFEKGSVLHNVTGSAALSTDKIRHRKSAFNSVLNDILHKMEIVNAEDTGQQTHQSL